MEKYHERRLEDTGRRTVDTISDDTSDGNAVPHLIGELNGSSTMKKETNARDKESYLKYYDKYGTSYDGDGNRIAPRVNLLTHKVFTLAADNARGIANKAKQDFINDAVKRGYDDEDADMAYNTAGDEAAATINREADPDYDTYITNKTKSGGFK